MLVIGQNSFGIDRFISTSVNGFVVIVNSPKRQHLEYRTVSVSNIVRKSAAAIS
jgi:hypothetical protein